MQLRDLVNAVSPVRIEGSLDREVSGLAYDSRRAVPGTVFVAIPGRRTDGHEYIDSAIDRGACAVITERSDFVSPRATQIRVSDSRAALAAAASAFFAHPSRQLRVVGITGTNGKTTVSFLLRHLLEAAGVRCGLIGTVRYEIGDRVIPAQRTTPEALEIQQLMAHMVRAGCSTCILEVSSHGLEQKRVDGVSFDIGVFTNLTHDHLDYHGNMEKYFAAKRRLFAGVGELKGPSRAVINIDDPYGARLAREDHLEVRLTYGLGETAVLRARDLDLRPDGTRMTLETPAGTFVALLPLIGRFNVYNALAAVGTALILNVPLPVVQGALASAPQTPGRLERVDRGQPFGVFVDYAHTEDALRNVLGALREVTRGRLLLVFGCGGDRDAGKRAPMGRVAGELADRVVVTSDNPRREKPEAIAAQIEVGLREAGGAPWGVDLDRSRAIDALVRDAAPGDTVLIAGKGHESYQESQDTVVPFDDRLVVTETLETLDWLDRSRETT
jgi:UDP-N-acetylmuramoyl-L-alanyl-D-glutamate--2,6-diaminopimelate ligase